MRVGDKVSTPYGEGQLSLYRETDRVYVLQLPFGTLYASKESILAIQEREREEEETIKMRNMTELSEAYSSLETMRKYNLEVTCQEYGIQDVDYDECTACMLERAVAAREETTSSSSSRFMSGRLGSYLVQSLPKTTRKSKAPKCLTCGSPACAKHSSTPFRREGITVCQDCEGVFHMDFIVDCMTLEQKERQARVDKLIDLYDRAVLLLKFSAQYMDELADSLEGTKKSQNKLNLGGSSAGFVSGVLGVAAAATILTPAGPPLLIASLMLGTGATAVQTGTDLNSKYFSEPHKVADRVIATHGMLLSVLTVTGTLRDAATRDHIRIDPYTIDGEESPIIRDLRQNHVKRRPAVLAGVTAGRFSMASAELLGMAEGATVARNATFFSRTGTAAARTLRFARFAGGALAAATLLIEARGMQSTVEAIRKGSPCEKADALRHIQQEIPDLPTTADLEKECSSYLAYMDNRGRKMLEEEALELLVEVAEAVKEEERKKKEEEDAAAAAAQKEAEEDAERRRQEEGISSVDGTEPSTTGSSSTSSSMRTSLWERIQLHKKTEQQDTKNTQ